MTPGDRGRIALLARRAARLALKDKLVELRDARQRIVDLEGTVQTLKTQGLALRDRMVDLEALVTALGG